MNRKPQILLALTIGALLLAACAAPAAPAGSSNPPAAVPVAQAQAQPEAEQQPAVENLPAPTPLPAIEAAPDPAPAATAVPAAPDTAAVSPSGLTAEEIAALQFMREEEKLAHDVYIFLFNTWGLQIFDNIAASEQTHTDSVRELLERYGLNDPAAGQAAGVFTDPALQALYNQLTAQGSLSLADALKVGAAIEEIDILDLQTRLAQTDNADIQLVYQNLEKGSRNHLRSFTSTLLAQTGETYTPQYLSVEAYQAIVSSAIESGGPGPGGSGQGGNGQGGNNGNNNGNGGQP